VADLLNFLEKIISYDDVDILVYNAVWVSVDVNILEHTASIYRVEDGGSTFPKRLSPC
jgi:hypothetical protein